MKFSVLIKPLATMLGLFAPLFFVFRLQFY